MSAVLSSSSATMPAAMRQLTRRFGPLAAIIALHIAFFYALQSGLLRQAAQVLPQEVFASFIAAEPAPKIEMPKAAAPTPVQAPAPKHSTPVKTPVAAASNTPAPAAPAAAPSPVAAASEAAAAPAAPSVPAMPKTVSGVEYIQAPQPEYPPLAKRNGEQGKVMLRVLVNERGRPERVEIAQSSGSPRLDEAARQAAMRALFKPHLEDGRAIAVFAMVPINFSL
jgi:protein TonB